MQARLETPRLRLRPCRAGDVNALHAIWTDADVRRYLWDDVVITSERAAETIASSVESFARTGVGLWAVFLKDREAIIGFCGFRAFAAADAGAIVRAPARSTSELELMYGLLPQYWKQGFATEASRAALHYLFANHPIERIWARADRPNEASFQVMKRLGMSETSCPGQTPATASYVISRAEFLGIT